MAVPTIWKSETVVNEVTGGRQWTSQVTALANGGYAVIYESALDVFMKVFDASGIGKPAVRVHSRADFNQNAADVTVLANGNIVATWSDSNSAEKGHHGQFRIFKPDGTPLTVAKDILGSDFFSPHPFDPNSMEVVGLKGGGFAVTWPGLNNINVRTYNSAGVATGTKTVLPGIRGSDVTALKDGGFVVAYSGPALSGGLDAFLQFYNANGSKRGNPVVVHNDSTDTQARIDVTTLASGKIAVAWDYRFEVAVRVFNANGTPATDQVSLNGPNTTAGEFPAIAELKDGRFLVAYVGKSPVGTTIASYNIYGRYVNADGTVTEAEFLIQDTNLNNQFEHIPSLAVLADGRVIVTWDDGRMDFGDPDSNIRQVILDPRESAINLSADKFGNKLIGTDFSDTIRGNDGNDNVSGQAGDDVLQGGRGNDVLRGGEGDDKLTGGVGSDTMNGGAGNDTVSYKAGAAAIVALDKSFKNLGAAAGDILREIENLEGSDGQNDKLSGDANANVLSGLKGNDILQGRGGGDSLFGGIGADNLNGGVGADVLDGGAGADILSGGADADAFRWISVAQGGDKITDFTESDVFEFEGSAFGFGDATGPLTPDALQIGNSLTAASANVRFIFRTSDDTLWYDTDGNGASAAKLIADLKNDYTTMSSDDIVLI